jgi:prephenate dehydratase
MKVSIQGQPGSFYDIAARKYFGPQYSPVCRNTFAEVFADIESGAAAFGLAAIENSLYGSINQNYDLLLKYEDIGIKGEIYLRVEHCLIGLPGTELKDIKEVYSHPVALAQCEEFLNSKLPHAEQLGHHDTAGSVAEIKSLDDPSKVAIASEAAAKLHGMTVLRRNIETHHQNYTRFIVLSKNGEVPIDATKTSFVLTKLRNDTDLKAGSLYRALGCFAKRGINLSKIESRPVIGKAWHYIFYMDFDTGLNDPEAQDALKELTELGAEYRVLGSYKQGEHSN